MEIERRFLIDTIPARLLFDSRSDDIVSVYLELSDDYKLRARKLGNRFLLTEKKGAGMVREENEKEITEQEFNKLRAKRGPDGIVEKRRYYVRYNDLALEMDVYKDVIKYPATVEIEFRSGKEAKSFRPPEWFGEEITDKPGHL